MDLRGEQQIPYGPFLCLAALAVIVGWRTVWFEVSPAYAVGWLVPGAMAVCLILLAVLLGLWMILRRLLFGSLRRPMAAAVPSSAPCSADRFGRPLACSDAGRAGLSLFARAEC